MSDHPATERYREMVEVNHAIIYLKNHSTHYADCGCLTEAAKLMRDELLAKIERLKVCGNCGHYMESSGRCDILLKRERFGPEPCEFAPSRWTERGGT